MASRVDTVAIGSASARLARRLVEDGRETIVAVVVEASELDADRSRVESGVARTVLEGYCRARGSTTARLRRALGQADHWLKSQPAPAGPQGAKPGRRVGVGAVVADPSGFTAACAGPVVLLGPASGRRSREQPGATPPAGDISRPLGAAGRPEPAWSGRPANAGQWLLITGPFGASALGPDGGSRPGLGSAAEAGAILRQALGPDAAGIWLGWSEAPPAGAAESERAGAGSIVSIPAPSSRRRPGARAPGAGLDRVAAALSAAWTSCARVAAHVARALLPEPDPETRAAPRLGRPTTERLWAAAAVLLPVAAIAVALLADRHPVPGAPPPGSAGQLDSRATSGASVGEAAPPTVSHDEGTAPDGARIVAGLSLLAGLDGSPDNERRLVVADGRPYVLDAVEHRVARLQDGAWVTALERGAAVGDRVVGNPVDLAWLPPADGTGRGRVVALDAAGELWALADGTVAHVPLASEPKRVLAESLAGAPGAVFLLDRARDAVVRFGADAGTAPSFTASGRDWLASWVDLADALDIGSDGTAVFVLWRDGRVARFVSGTRQPEPADGATPGSFEAAGLYVAMGADRLLVADRTNGRLLVLSKDGAPVERLARPVQPAAADEARRMGRFDRLHALWWDEPAGRLYVVCGDSLLAGPYQP